MENEPKKGSDGKKKGGGAASSGAAKFTLKFLAPEALAGAIVGHKGTKIAAMREQFGAGVQLSDRKETYPGTDCRQLTLQCDKEETLLALAKHILGIHLESIEPDALQKSKSPGAVAESLGKDGDLKVCMLVPRAAGGGIIGKGGAVIKELRESSGVKKMTVGQATNADPATDQKVNIVGPMDAVETVLKEVSKHVQSLRGEVWFGTWVAAGPAAASGGGKGACGAADEGWDDWGGWNDGWGGWSGGGGWGSSSGMDLLAQVARETPPRVLEDSRGFAMSCTVPNNLVGGLIGRRGANIQNVKDTTKVEISIRPIPDDAEHNSLNIVGPLPNACAAYMLMMQLYLDAEEAGS